MDAIYAAYGTGWDAVAGAADGSQDLAQEAIYLGRLLLALMPDEPDVEGLLALMLYCEARRAARRSPLKRFVPLRDQDVSLWSRGMITEAESLLTSASQSARFGRYQCEAAIQSVHVQRAVTGVTNHDALKILYDLLAARCPSIGVLVGRAAAALDAGAAEKALDHLDALPAQQIEKYQPYWVTRAHALAATKNFNEARNALQRAIGLSEDSAVRSYLCDVSARWEAEN
jgi:RNA polymerase sigma-70 factor (ECF subfamily)